VRCAGHGRLELEAPTLTLAESQFALAALVALCDGNRDAIGVLRRQVCKSCGERAMVSVPEAVASFCLSCGAVTIDGERLDVDGQLPGLRRWIRKAAGVVHGPDG
jgi:hypothetical protein